MSKQNFMSVPVSPGVQVIFDEFVKQKEITKTTALSDMLELYMISVDEKLYLDLKKNYLNVEGVREMVLGKADDYSQMSITADTYIFMKLGWSKDSSGNDYDGKQTIMNYMDDEKTRGYTWFNTESLFFGMAKKQVKYYKKLIEQGKVLKMLFAIGENAGGTNDIQYCAEVLDIESNQTPISSPEPNACPGYYRNDARIWIKIKNIQEETSLKANNLLIKSSGALLKDVISNSQFHFGYVVKK